MLDFQKFAEKINVKFNDINLLRQACTHRSFLNENKNVGEHNERLEFLGDAVLELVITSYLYRRFPDSDEGAMTAYRSALVNTNSLSRVAEALEINEWLLLSKGESRDTGRARSIILADSVEAIIGAVYLDQGYNGAANFISQHLLEVIDIDDIIAKKLWLDAKSRFQERSQDEVGQTPTYKLVKEAGPDHSKIFTVGVFIGDTQIATGSGLSKQEAEQKSAEKALEVKGW